MNHDWLLVVDLSVLALLLGVSTLMKSKFRFMRNFPIPIPIIAGFLGLLIGAEGLGLFQFDNLRLEGLVYHLMSFGFIALSLKSKTKLRKSGYMKSGMLIVSTYALQGFIGFGLTLVMVATLFPNLFPPFGLLLPLGYGQGPGQAYSIGKTWEELGFQYGGNMGLTIAAFGYIWACLGGIPYTMWLLKRRKLSSAVSDYTSNDSVTESIFDEETVSELPMKESIDGLTLQIVLIGFVYLLTYGILWGLTSVLKEVGTFGQTLAQLLWGFSFIIGALLGAGVRFLLDVLKEKHIMTRCYTSNYLLERISGFSFDFMITAAISAISLYMLRDYWAPVLILTTVGGIVTVVYINYMSKRLYAAEPIENTLAMYGMLTGTISTGLALLREVDPNFRSQAAKNLVFGSGTGLLVGLPMMILLSFPTLGYKENNPLYYWYTMIGMFVYWLILIALMGVFRKRIPKSD